jgi:hypothetical protein
MTAEDQGVEEFLKTANRVSLGRRCETCRLTNVQDVEKAAVAFNTARRDGRTHVGWERFVRNHMKPKLAYPFVSASLQKHLRKCCGVEIA